MSIKIAVTLNYNFRLNQCHGRDSWNFPMT